MYNSKSAKSFFIPVHSLIHHHSRNISRKLIFYVNNSFNFKGLFFFIKNLPSIQVQIFQRCFVI